MTAPTSGRFRAIGCDHEIHVTDPSCLGEALVIARQLIDDLDVAASRFRPDSEVSRVAQAATNADVTVEISPLLADCLAAALHAARITSGLVDPLVGRAMEAAGYDADLDVVRSRRVQPAKGATPGSGPSVGLAPGRDPAFVPALSPTPAPTLGPTWHDLRLDPVTRRLDQPRGTLLDLGATAKAYAADRLAQRLATSLPGGFLVNLGGDIAVSGSLPTGTTTGWEIGVEAATGEVLQVVVSTGQAITTSSTRLRTWQQDGVVRHHIVDPRTGTTAPTVWAQVSCAGSTCLEANAASTAAIVLGEAAPAWLSAHGIPARLDRVDGSMVLTPGWPEPTRQAA